MKLCATVRSSTENSSSKSGSRSRRLTTASCCPAAAWGCDASENWRSSVVTRNSACSAISTALSPTRFKLRAIRMRRSASSRRSRASSSASVAWKISRLSLSIASSSRSTCYARARSRATNAAAALCSSEPASVAIEHSLAPVRWRSRTARLIFTSCSAISSIGWRSAARGAQAGARRARAADRPQPASGRP